MTNRHAQFGDDITADHRAYYWSWSERIAPIADPVTAARRITSVLRATPAVTDPGQPPPPGPRRSSWPRPFPGICAAPWSTAGQASQAQVTVPLGQMGTPGQHRQAVWMEAWGKSYPMCGPCWEATRQVARPAARPVITGTTCAPAG